MEFSAVAFVSVNNLNDRCTLYVYYSNLIFDTAYWTSGYDTNVFRWSNGNIVSVPYSDFNARVAITVNRGKLYSTWAFELGYIRPLCQVVAAA